MKLLGFEIKKAEAKEAKEPKLVTVRCSSCAHVFRVGRSEQRVNNYCSSC